MIDYFEICAAETKTSKNYVNLILILRCFEAIIETE
jgi:hypothetical protein